MSKQTYTTPDNVYAVILAGGSGTRFWPKSRQKTPKQLCKLGGSPKTMLEITLDRLEGFIPPSRRIIVTHKDQYIETKKITEGQCAAVIAEPEARNTANALALAAIEVKNLYNSKDTSKSAILVSLHADSLIEDVPAMLSAYSNSIKLAEKNTLCLIGVLPKYAETGYGYIERGESLEIQKSYKVASFREKPDAKTAQKYIDSKTFYWNAGLFTFPVDLLLSELAKNLSGTVENLNLLLKTENTNSFTKVSASAFAETYSKLPKISIDHAVLEVSKSVTVVEADMGWQDVGSWEALSMCFPCDANGNYVDGQTLVIDSKNCTIDTDGPLIAALGLNDIVIVHSKNAILVCPKNRSQDVKVIVEQLKTIGRSDLV